MREYGASCFADGFVVALTDSDRVSKSMMPELIALLQEEFDLDKATATWWAERNWQ